MGNESSTTYTSRTHYTVHCHKHTWINVYDGYSESEYNYYRNSSGNCWKCAEERNEIERKAAEKRAREAKEAEEQRVREIMKRLEIEERQRQEQAARDLEAAREAERVKMRAELEKERIKIDTDILKESDEKIREKTAELKEKKIKNPYTAWRKSKTLETVKDIGNEALRCSAAGQVISERVEEIKQELQQSLKADYKIVKSEVTRYEGYAKDMKSMTTEFIAAFEGIFKPERGKQGFDKGKFDEDRKEWDKLDDSGNDDSDKEDDQKFYQNEMKENVEALSTAINKMKFKLLLMQQYYIKMEQDFDIFAEFIRERRQEYNLMKSGITSNLTKVAGDLKTKKERNVFEGQSGDEYNQKLYIEEKYDVINCTKEKREIQIGTKTTKGNYAMEGALIGGIAGGVAGGIVGGAAGGSYAGPGGVVFGAAAGARGGAEVGALIGACIGSLIEKKTKTPIIRKEIKWNSTLVKNGGSVPKKVKQQVYDGLDHARALEQVRDAMMETIQGYLDELDKEQETAIKKKEEFAKLELHANNMIKKADNFKGNIDVLKDILSANEVMSKSQRDRLDKKWNDTKQKVNQFLRSIKPMREINEEGQ